MILTYLINRPILIFLDSIREVEGYKIIFQLILDPLPFPILALRDFLKIGIMGK